MSRDHFTNSHKYFSESQEGARELTQARYRDNALRGYISLRFGVKIHARI